MASKFFLKVLCQPVGRPWVKDSQSGGASFEQESNLFGIIQNVETLEVTILFQNTATNQNVYLLLPKIGDFLKEHSGENLDQKTILFYEDNQPLCFCINGTNKKSKNYSASAELRAIADAHHIDLQAVHITKQSELNLEYEKFKDSVGLNFNQTFNLFDESSSPKLR